MKRTFAFLSIAALLMVAPGNIEARKGGDDGSDPFSRTEVCAVITNGDSKATFCDDRAALMFDTLMRDPVIASSASVPIYTIDDATGCCTVCTRIYMGGSGTVYFEYCRRSCGFDAPGC